MIPSHTTTTRIRRVTGGKISVSTDPDGSTGRPVIRDENPDAARY